MCGCADVQMKEKSCNRLSSSAHPHIRTFAHHIHLFSQTNALAPNIAASASFSSLKMSLTLF